MLTKQLVTETLRLLSRYTQGTLNINVLRGPQNAWKRAEILSLWRQYKVARRSATVTVLRDEFYKMQRELGTGFVDVCEAAVMENFITWASEFLIHTREDIYEVHNTGRTVRS